MFIKCENGILEKSVSQNSLIIQLYFAADILELLQSCENFVRVASLRRKTHVKSQLTFPNQKEKQFLTVKRCIAHTKSLRKKKFTVTIKRKLFLVSFIVVKRKGTSFFACDSFHLNMAFATRLSAFASNVCCRA